MKRRKKSGIAITALYSNESKANKQEKKRKEARSRKKEISWG